MEYADKLDKKQNLINQMYGAKYAMTDKLYRGTRIDELESIAATGKLGVTDSGNTRQFGFVSLSADRHVAQQYAGSDDYDRSPILIEFDKDVIDRHVVHHGYSVTGGNSDRVFREPDTLRDTTNHEHRLPNGIDWPKTGVTIRPLSEDAAIYIKDNYEQFKHIGRVITEFGTD